MDLGNVGAVIESTLLEGNHHPQDLRPWSPQETGDRRNLADQYREVEIAEAISMNAHASVDYWRMTDNSSVIL